MDSQKAADVRDAINGLPCVAHDPEVSENYPSDGNTTVTRRGVEWTHTGECVHLDGPKGYTFSPAEISQAGEIAFGENAPKRPCYEVLLQPLSIPTRPLPSISIPPAVVHEIAKYDCRIRVRAGYRGEYTPGTIQVRDDFAQEQDPDADGDRCSECQSTRFKLRNGVPVCERCGNRIEETESHTEPKIEDYT